MIILVKSDQDASKIKDITNHNKSYKYLCLSEDYEKRLFWDKELSLHYRKITINDLLNRIVNDLRSSFLNFIRQLSARYHSDEWWMSRIPEQNTFVSRLFINCCKLELIRRLLVENKEKDLIVIADDYSLLRCAKKFCGDIHEEYATIGICPFSRERFKTFFIPFYHIWVFLRESIIHWYTAFSTKKHIKPHVVSSGHRIMVHTWIDEACFGKEGRFIDRYFGRLLDWLEGQGNILYVVPLIYNIQRPIKDAYTWLRASNKYFLFPHDYYKITDYIKASICAVKILFLPPGKTEFLNMDITDLIRLERQRQSGGSFYSIMYLYLPKRLRDAGYKFDILLDVFEGMVPEKALLLGMKKAFPDAFCVGYQHTVVSKNLLCYFVHDGNAVCSVLPDRIVCTGQLIKNFLKQGGIPEERLLTGCAMRYEYLWKRASQDYSPKREEDQSFILVALPLQTSSAIEIINKLSQCVIGLKHTFFYVKPHPMMGTSAASDIVKQSGWPANYAVVEGAMDQWLAKSDLLVSSASATALEALIAGIPVVLIGSETSLDLNPLDWFEMDYAKTYYDPIEIMERIMDLLKNRERAGNDLRELGQTLLEQCFAPVTEANMETFIKRDYH